MGPPELAILLGLFVLLFGYRKLPDLGRALGESVEYLRDATRDK